MDVPPRTPGDWTHCVGDAGGIILNSVIRNYAAMANDSVEPVLRALSVLEAMNANPANLPLADLAHATGLPKPTLVRLLDTLIAGGYVRRISRREGYVLAERVTRLSGGFRHGDAIVEAARPFLSALTAQFKWPVGLATLDRDAMLVRLSTVRESPFSTDANLVNRRVPMLMSALGRAYLAYCSDDERETILALLRASPREMNRPARDAHYVATLLRSVRRQGFASPSPARGDPYNGMAVPLLDGTSARGAITLRYLDAAITEPDAAARFLPALRRAAGQIVAAAS
jgi:IclR family mhp operon transcriptional activator